MLSRKTPMRRAGFARKLPPPALPRAEREPPAQLPRLVRPCPAVRIGDQVRAVPKADYVRSAVLREAYRALPCQWPGCGIEDGTVCCAHSNWAVHGKGKSIKASDDRGAALCFRHHSMLDQGGELSDMERRAHWWWAHGRSVGLLQARSLWPGAIEVPEVLVCPWDDVLPLLQEFRRAS